VSTIKHAVIAAAGLGSRLGLGKTKCLLEIDGRPLISYLLTLLEEVEDVRVVVGFQEDEVMNAVLKYRKDVIFVRNSEYLTTSTLASYWLGAQGVREHCLYMDADILFEPASFQRFLTFCSQHLDENVIAVTKAKTKDAVFVELTEGKVTHFTREQAMENEWANLCYIHPELLVKQGDSVYQQLSLFLPLTAQSIVSYEIDTKSDMEQALLSHIARDDHYLSGCHSF